MRWLAAIVLLAIASAAVAQTTPADDARAAAQRLNEAANALENAQRAGNRISALTQTLRAFEDGLAALRDGQRRLALHEQSLTQELDARKAKVADMLGILQTMNAMPEPVLTLHPSGPVGTARAGLIMADIVPAVQVSVDQLTADLAVLRELRELQDSAAASLQAGLEGLQKARTDLSQAMSERTELPRRYTDDPIRMALLIASAETLDSFAAGLGQVTDAEITAPDAAPALIPGTLPLPVRSAAAPALTQTSLSLQTAPGALVTSPVSATIRYRGALLDYANVIVLEPQTGILLVLAGMDMVYGDIGEVIRAGSPIGLMPQGTKNNGANPASETLYVEIRQDNVPLDPAKWFKTDKEQ